MSDGLVLVRSDGETTRHPVRPDMVIGRGRGSDLRLRDHGVQRRHAVIEHFASGFAIRGLSSRAEILVNENQVSRRTIRPGDRIAIGPARFTVEESVSDETDAAEVPGKAPAAAIPDDPVPAQVLARVRKPETTSPLFAGPPMQRRRSVATHRSATFFCMAIVLADAIALGVYIEGI
jgi:pSer/pThr/pTyr-binding forkhead associated (FHA) protein